MSYTSCMVDFGVSVISSSFRPLRRRIRVGAARTGLLDDPVRTKTKSPQTTDVIDKSFLCESFSRGARVTAW